MTLNAISTVYTVACISSTAPAVPLSTSETDSDTTRSLLLFLNLFQLRLLVHLNAKCQYLREQIWRALWLCLIPMWDELFLCHKGLCLRLWGEIACVCVPVSGCKLISENRCLLSTSAPAVCMLLSHQTGCCLSTPVQRTSGKFHFLSSSCLLPLSWVVTHISPKIKERDVMR